VGSVEEEDRVVFTHAIQSGPAPRSYGLEVAKLSGLPREVLQRAAEVLTGLSAKGSSSKPPSAANRQQTLFAAAPQVVKDPVLEKLRATIASLDLDGLSAREALQVLYALREQVKG